MKILVVYDAFIRGGLETQIKTYYENLPESTEMVFAFSSYSEEVSLKNAKIYTDFHFSYNATVTEFCNNVERLVEIIEKENIDVIHTHPFFCFFSALFASQITKTKLLYSYHGLTSFNFLSSVTTTALFKYALEIGAVSSVHAVSEAGINCFKKLGYENVTFMPNPIDLKKFKKAEYLQNKKWALISRIDADKLTEIKLFLSEKDKYNIESVDIYGAGASETELLSFIEENNLSQQVHFKGFCNNLYDTVSKNYNGIIGIGRVVLEGLTMGIPVFLIGYGKISGFINKDLYEKIKVANFSNYGINDVNFVMPSKEEIELICEDVNHTLSIDVIIEKYIESIKSKDSVFVKNLLLLYNEIKSLSQDDYLSKCHFYYDKSFYGLMKTFIGNYSSDASINSMFTQADLSYLLFDLLNANDVNLYQSLNQQLNQQVSILENELNAFSNEQNEKFSRQNEKFSRQNEKFNQQDIKFDEYNAKLYEQSTEIEVLKAHISELEMLEKQRAEREQAEWQRKNMRFHRRVIRKLRRIFKI